MQTESGLPETVIDFAECEREPICHLGLIQPHGYLIGLDSELTITHASANIGRIFQLSAAEALGLPFHQLAGAEAANSLRAKLPQLVPGPADQLTWPGAAQHQCCWVHRRDSHYVLEWEPLPPSEAESSELISNFLVPGLQRIESAAHVHRQAQIAGELAAQLTGYDRVMVYQFHPDWSGEVIAEIRPATAEPFLGLRYPSSDIPPQARKLYAESLVRVLVDVNSAPASLLSSAAAALPLDLTHSQLRAMSPYHIEYLRNMKVGATATASLMVGEPALNAEISTERKLWGLIACHHHRRHVISPGQKMALGQIAQVLSRSVEKASEKARQKSLNRLKEHRSGLNKTITDVSTGLSSVLFGPDRFRRLLHCSGTAVWTAGGVLRMGDAPSAPELHTYASRLLAGDQDLVAIDSRMELLAQLGVAPENPGLSGLVALIISRQPALLLFGFRQESIREVIWGGDINVPVLRDEQTGSLSPRRSFARYKQSVRGKCSSWTAEDLATAAIVVDVLRTRTSGAGQIDELIRCGFDRLRQLVTGTFTLQDSLLDAIGNGISLLFRSDGDQLTLRYANQTLLDLAETCAENGASFTEAGTLLESLGLPLDLLTRTEMEASQAVLPTAREGSRHFLVERKLGLEIADEKGTVSLSALVFTDTTRTERAREALQAAQDRAKHLAFLKSSFLANMSHEIRTPMNGILGMVQLLQTTQLDAEQRGFLDVVQRSGDMMLKIINEILDISKIEAGHVQLEIAPFDLTALIDGVVDLMRPRAAEKGIAISASYDFPPPRWFEGDCFRLRQVILNLVGNSVKFTNKGQVQIRVQSEAQPSTNRMLNISISDSGIGIPEEQLAQIFEKFHQADPSTTRKHGGTGLGLSISRELITLMRGTISLYSTVGVGSTFTIAIPLPQVAGPAQDAAPVLEIKAGAAGAGLRILVAEDDLTNQIVIEAMLKTKGFEVAIAESGQRALEAFQDQPWDLILMDCQMPELDGYEATQRIRSLEGSTRHTPIIALTANALKEDRQRCLDAGMDDYLAKPVDMMALWAALQKWNCLPAVSKDPVRT